MREIPVLLTLDVDPSSRYEDGVHQALDLLREVGIPATFFFTAQPTTASILSEVIKSGHEIGCHGLTHSFDEEFNRLSEETQREILSSATKRLEDLSGNKIVSFRAPRVKISTSTLKILEELGYQIDSSVCSQRLDFLSSNLVNLGWLLAPRKPYHPGLTSPYRSGEMKILEVPVSALILPFLSGTMRLLGLKFMKQFFNLLRIESQITGKPIVYLVHPYEFLYQETVSFKWRMLAPNRMWFITGLPIRGPLVRRHLGPEVKRMNSELIQYMRSKENVRFLTMKQYLQDYPIPPR